MAFRLPTFNLLCNISAPIAPFNPSIPPMPYRIVGQACQLTFGRRVNVASTGGTTSVGVITQTMNLLLPALVDIRGPASIGGFDMVEVPAGSGRFYQVVFVDDIGKGFANEHRTAGIFAFQFPVPLP
jgi:hypothetical protein